GVIALIKARHGLQNLARLLGAGGVVEIHQRRTMHLLLQNRKVAAISGGIKALRGGAGEELVWCSAHQRSSITFSRKTSSAALRAGKSPSSNSAKMKASISIFSAWARGTPRLCK